MLTNIRHKLIYNETFSAEECLTSPQIAADFAKPFFEGADREKFFICYLDAKNCPLAMEEISIGGRQTTMAEPAMVFKTGLCISACSAFLFHNHLSKSSLPSAEDLRLTDRLGLCGEMLGIRVLDHIILNRTGSDSYSMVEHNRFDPEMYSLEIEKLHKKMLKGGLSVAS